MFVCVYVKVRSTWIPRYRSTGVVIDTTLIVDYLFKHLKMILGSASFCLLFSDKLTLGLLANNYWFSNFLRLTLITLNAHIFLLNGLISYLWNTIYNISL